MTENNLDKMSSSWNQTSVNIRYYIAFLTKWVWLFLLITILTTIFAYWYSSSQIPQYVATASIFISQPNAQDDNNYKSLVANERLGLSYSRLMVQRPVLESVITDLNLNINPDRLKRNIRVNVIPDTQILEVRVTDSDPERAAEIANTIGVVFVRFNEDFQASRYQETKESLVTQISAAEAQIENTLKELDELGVSTDVSTSREFLQVKLTAYQESYNDLLKQLLLKTSLENVSFEPSSEEEVETDVYLQLDTIQQRINEIDDRIDQFSYFERQGVEFDLLQSRRNAYQQVYDNLIRQLTQGEFSTSSDEILIDQGPSAELLAEQLAMLEDNIKVTAQELEQLGGTLGETSKIDRLEANLALYRQNYSNLLRSYEQVRLAEIQSTPSVILVEPAIPPGSPISPQVLRDTLFGCAFGLMLSLGIVFVIEISDDTIKRPEDITMRLGLPILGVIAKHPIVEGGPISEREPRSPITEAFRSLRTSIQYASIDHPVRSFLVTSPEASAGKSTIATNLSVVLAQSGRKTILIDADMRRPRVHELLNLDRQIGLSSLFVFENSVSGLENDPEKAIKKTTTEGLYALTSGDQPPNPAELLGSEKMSTILSTIHEDADMVVVDAPPLMAVTDAAVLATRVDGVLIVLQPGQTKLGSAQQTIERLRRVGANIIGVVINNVVIDRRNYVGYYYRYEDSYYQYVEDSEKASIFSFKKIWVWLSLGIALLAIGGWLAFTQGLFPVGNNIDEVTEVPKTEAVASLVEPSFTPTPTGEQVLLEDETPTPQSTLTATQTPTETLTPTITDTLPPPTPGPELMTPFGPNEKYVLHQVVEGESLPIIAQTYETFPDVISAVNGLTPNRPLRPDDVIVVVPGLVDPEEVSEPLRIVKTEADVTQGYLAHTYNVAEEEIQSFNDLGQHQFIPANRWLIFPLREFQSPTPEPTPTRTIAPTMTASPVPTPDLTGALKAPFGPNDEFVLHRVKPGESLPILAGRYLTSSAVIRAVNGVEGSIQLDQVLVIMPGRQDSAGLSALSVMLIERPMAIEDVASRYNISLDDLLLYNEFTAAADELDPGDWIIYPTPEEE